MSAIFISHSSKDNDRAQEMAEWLRGEQYPALFLDIDPEAGLVAGREWERQLYTKLRSCHAVLVLCSEHSMGSAWVFAELTHARALGKHIFPVKISPCEIRPILMGYQVVDLTTVNKGYERLRRGLQEVLGPRGLIAWDSTRPPYPGLLSFQEEDAPIFFGRDDEIRDGIAWLNRLHRFGGARLALLLGVSGSGKSSLVRAGLVPVLKRDRTDWLVMKPFRPLRDPWGELARALLDTFSSLGDASHEKTIREALSTATSHSAPDGGPLLQLAQELLNAAGRPTATILMIIDQLEELLDHPSETPGGRFNAFLQAALANPDSPLMVLGTLRSDMLGRFQRHPSLGTIPFADWTVGSLSRQGFAQVIEGPASVAELELEPGLVQEMVADTATEDALPLLAFTLRELWERYGDDRRLTLHEYREKLGRLHGSVARAAEAVMSGQRLDARAQEAIRAAFLALVRLNEDGQYVRRAARWSDLPVESHAVLKRFLAARLLVPREREGEQVVELAHEALLRSWRPLADWLDEDRSLLQLREGIRRAAVDWQAQDRDRNLLVHRGGRLEDAQRLMHHPRLSLSPLERDYIQACVELRETEEAEREEQRRRELEAAKRLAEEQQQRLIETRRLRGVSIAQALAAQVPRQLREFHLHERAALLARQAYLLHEANGGTVLDQIDEALRAVLSHPYFSVTLTPPPPSRSGLLGLAYSSDGARLAVCCFPVLFLLSTQAPGEWRPVFGTRDDWATAVAFSPRDEWLAWGTVNGKVCVQSLHSPEVRPIEPGGQELNTIKSVSFSPDGKMLAACSGHDVSLWHLAAPERPFAVLKVRTEEVEEVSSIAFSPDGNLLAFSTSDRRLGLWNLQHPKRKPRFLQGTSIWAKAVAFNRQSLLAAAGDMGRLELWDLSTEPPMLRTLPGAMAETLAFSPDGSRIAVAGMAGYIELRSLLASESGSEPAVLRGHTEEITQVAFDADGKHLASSSRDGTLRIWDLSTPKAQPIVRPMNLDAGYSVYCVACCDGQVAVSFDRGIVQFFELEEPLRTRMELRGDALGPVFGALPISAVAFAPKHKVLVTGHQSGVTWLWNLGQEPPRPLPLPGQEGWVGAVAVNADETLIASCGGDGGLRLWELSDTGAGPRVVRLHPKDPDHGLHAVAFSPKAPLVAVGGDRGLFILPCHGEPEEAPRPVEGYSAPVRALAFSPDGRYLASGCEDRKARVLDMNTQQSLELLHEGEVMSVTFSPEGRWLATGSMDGAIRLWDIQRPAQAAIVLRGHEEMVSSVAFTGDGKRLVSGGVDGTVRLWVPWTRKLADWVCTKVWRDLTPGEWRTFIGEDIPYEPTCPAR